ncbi:unnamed protein product [Hermetia illucens]|uniref:Major facilitator superfamily (MFS) profile domain-containing protein n=1 Tax=Hermetia illucens TaxID=343691 RepID=A0A7R8UYQ2_HERIL|nr:sialin-like [Hermetia illucens]CAD7089584.1 unnamed protein product [Hermetia illucens]
MTNIALVKFWEKCKNPPTRLFIAVMLFLACLVAYMTRVNFSILIVAMVKSTNPNITAPDYGPRFDWSQQDQSLLLGAYFWGYMITSLMGGILAAVFGGRNLVAGCLILSGILTSFTPYLAIWNFWSVIVVRFILGLFGGPLYPGFHDLISKWAPPDEKGKFVSALMGGTFGTVVTWPLCGLMTESLGYTWSFHMTAIICAIVGVIFLIVVADRPEKHKHITETEREYIVNSLKENVTKQSKFPPLKHALMSLPFWALLVLHYGNMWGLFFLLTAAPKFMAEVLGFKLTQAGFLSSLPYLARLISAFIFGQIGDTIRRKSWMSVTFMRKFFCIFSHIIPGGLLMVMAFGGRTAAVCVALMTLSLGFNGAATLTNLANSQDLAPNYAGSLYGIINFVGTTPGFFSPMIVAYFTQDQNTIDEWMWVFITGAVVYVIPSLFFMIFGSGMVQYWNDMLKSEVKKEDPEKTS